MLFRKVSFSVILYLLCDIFLTTPFDVTYGRLKNKLFHLQMYFGTFLLSHSTFIKNILFFFKKQFIERKE